MTTLIPVVAVSPLRQRLIDEMYIRRFGPETQRNYIRDVGRFATFLGRPPDTATAEDVRRFQIEQCDLSVPAPTMNAIVSALRFFFIQTLDRPDLARKLVRMRYERKLPVVLSQDEVARLLEATTCLKHQAALSVAYGAGLRAAEVAALKVRDIDSERMLLRVSRPRPTPRERDDLPCATSAWKAAISGGPSDFTLRAPISGLMCRSIRLRSIRSVDILIGSRRRPSSRPLSASSRYQSQMSATVGAARAASRVSIGSSPRATSPSRFFASMRACSTVSTPHRASVSRRLRPSALRYWRTKVLRPDGSTRTPNPRNSLSQCVSCPDAGIGNASIRVLVSFAISNPPAYFADNSAGGRNCKHIVSKFDQNRAYSRDLWRRFNSH